MLKETSSYKGTVNVAIKKSGKTIKKTTHNTGLPDMAFLFAKAISGNLNHTTDIPRLIDVGYIVTPTESEVNPGDSGIWMSILNNPVDIGGRQYKFDANLQNWVGVLTATIYYSDLNGGILDDVITNIENNNYVLKLRLCSYDYSDRRYFAEVNLTSDFLTDIKETTSAIITWYTELLYNNSETELTEGNVTQGGNN